MNIIEKLEKEQISKVADAWEGRQSGSGDEKSKKSSTAKEERLAEFNVGDTVKVNTRVTEGNKERIQVFEGIVIGKRGTGIGASFTVRKISHGEGVERVFQLQSPRIDSITVVHKGKVRRAKLNYLRDRLGKKATQVRSA